MLKALDAVVEYCGALPAVEVVDDLIAGGDLELLVTLPAHQRLNVLSSQRRRVPPNSEPSVPRTTWRPICVPSERMALTANASSGV